MSQWQSSKCPPPYDLARADACIERLCQNLQSINLDDDQRSIIAALAGNSPFLARIIEKEPEFTAELLAQGPDKALVGVMNTIAEKAPNTGDLNALMALLRRGKARLALLTAAADVSGVWSLQQVTSALSDYADTALEHGLAHLLHGAMKKGDLPWPAGEPQPATPELSKNSGFVILALGKLGGRELNYSSDIDLIALFDSDKVDYQGRKSATECFVRITQDLIKIMQQRTPDGYVFRMDFRLRPDPSATPLALSMNAAEVYYQTIGQNWERSAMIKARPAAGDMAVGTDFINRMRPFVWRRNLDFAAISDIHAIKTQVHAFHRHQDIAVKGHDIKIGRGGIREIEFLAQINQLIFGGRETALRTRKTLRALGEITKLGKLDETAMDELERAYVYLRTLEHRLQMINDEQTHKLPESDDAVDHIACFMGADSRGVFEKTLLQHLSKVQQHYGELPGGEAKTQAPQAITGQDINAQLAGFGFKDMEVAQATLTRWNTGRYRALRSPRALSLLEGCSQDLLGAFGETSDPDRALARFDDFISKLPAGVQLFSLFQANSWLFRLIANIMGSAPQLAEHLARRPSLLDAVLAPGFFDALPQAGELKQALESELDHARDYEDLLDICRNWLNDRRFEVGVHILEGLADTRTAGRALSNLADVMINCLVPRVEEEFAHKHGKFPACGLGIIAMGSYGGEELSYTSDLDLVFLYKAPGADALSDGEKQLGPSQYFSRLAQQVITALSARTAAGALFELDLRLRPSGRAGPLVVTLETFEQYQAKEAWVWEHMALTRARVVYGAADFATDIEVAIGSALAKDRGADQIKTAVLDMRSRIDQEFSTGNIWNMRNVRGGLVDIEYICQYLLLLPPHDSMDAVSPSILNAVASLQDKGKLSPEQADTLCQTYIYMQSLRGVLRLSHGSQPTEDAFSTEVKALMCKAAEMEDFAALKSRLEEYQRLVYALFQDIVG